MPFFNLYRLFFPGSSARVGKGMFCLLKCVPGVLVYASQGFIKGRLTSGSPVASNTSATLAPEPSINLPNTP